MDVFIIYPERRWVPVERINDWYSDAVANGEIADEYLGLSNEQWAQQAAALSDAGLITLGNGRP